IRVVMLGKTGVGKSLLGNNILGKDIFSSKVGAQSCTKELTRAERMLDEYYKLVLVDTPGLFDTSTNNMGTAKILVRTAKENRPGPHIFIFVLSIGRFTIQELETVELLKDLFGNHLVTESVDSLLQMIKDVFLQNKKQHYTDELLADAEKKFEEKLQRELEDRNSKLEAELQHQKESQLKQSINNSQREFEKNVQFQKDLQKMRDEKEAIMKQMDDESKRKQHSIEQIKQYNQD
ncbi:hypothetical protein LOTGIDRAFT_75642, partial [Lottia gigantea]